MFDLSGALDVVKRLNDAGIRADLDPAALSLPGVWVQVAGFEAYAMGRFKTNLRLQLLTSDTDVKRAMGSLVDLARKVHPVERTTKATARTVVLPDGNPMPALEVLTSVLTNSPTELPEETTP